MRNLLLSLCLIPLLLACGTTGPVFVKMSDEEIAEYNSMASINEQVICVRETRAGTHIKRRYCETLQEMYDNLISSYGKLNAVNAGSSLFFSTF